MKTIKPVIGVGRIPQGKEFRSWLKAQGYETDTWPGTECYVDGELVSEDMQAQEIWQELWDEFKEGA